MTYKEPLEKRFEDMMTEMSLMREKIDRLGRMLKAHKAGLQFWQIVPRLEKLEADFANITERVGYIDASLASEVKDIYKWVDSLSLGGKSE